jgi:hypothetical protein
MEVLLSLTQLFPSDYSGATMDDEDSICIIFSRHN